MIEFGEDEVMMNFTVMKDAMFYTDSRGMIGSPVAVEMTGFLEDLVMITSMVEKEMTGFMAKTVRTAYLVKMGMIAFMVVVITMR